MERSYSDEYGRPGHGRWKTIIWQTFAAIIAGIFVLSLVLGGLGSPRQADESPGVQTETGTVTNVLSGNTITVQGEHEEFVVRYIGVSPPVPGAPLNNLATEVNRGWVDGKEVLLERDERDVDSQGRMLRYVYLGDAMINANLIYQGLAQADVSDNNTRYNGRFEQLEAEAKAAGRGIWADGSTAPRVSIQQHLRRNRRS